MPTYNVRPIGKIREDTFWVYGIDEFDARSQLSLTLRLHTHDEEAFECLEEPRFSMPLNVILHSTAEWTEVALPLQLRCGTRNSSTDGESEA